jgi:NAD-dependent deacetylase
MRPAVVWFGEIPLCMDEIGAALAEADRFVAIGTSGSVYPAAGLVAEARALGVPCTELNLEPSENARLFDARRYGPASEIVPAFVSEILGGIGA